MHNDPKMFQNENKVQQFFNPNNFQIPNNYLPYNSLNSNIIPPQNNTIPPNPLYNIFQKAAEKTPTSYYPINLDNNKVKIENNDQNAYNNNNESNS